MAGIERFIAGLDELGFRPEQRGSLVVVKLDIVIADRADLSIVGADPPDDFPNIPLKWSYFVGQSEGDSKVDSDSLESPR